MAARRGRQAEYNKSRRDRLVDAAHAKVERAIRKGKLPHFSLLKCADCSEPAECYDHRDYTDPLKVEAVCKGCNNRRGPGWPFPEAGDGTVHKLIAKIKDTNDGGGEGYEPLAARLTADIEVSTAPDVTYWDLMDFNRKNIEFGERNWKNRADFFKRHDPWFG